MNSTEIVSRYVGDLTRVLNAIEPGEIQHVIRTLDSTRERHARIFVAGNGGSAATASHLCTDLSVGLKRKGLPGFDIQSLTDNASISTAVANDVAYDKIFSAQLEGVIQANDVLIAISASGNSPNILSAVKLAQQIGATVIGVSGFDGGELKRLADVSFHVQTSPGEYGLVEDVHLVLNHILHTYFASSTETVDKRTTKTPRERVPSRSGSDSRWVRFTGRKGRRRWPSTPNPLS